MENIEGIPNGTRVFYNAMCIHRSQVKGQCTDHFSKHWAKIGYDQLYIQHSIKAPKPGEININNVWE